MNFAFEDFTFDFISKILLGSLLGTLLTAWFASRRSKRDLCIQLYERWISNPLYQNRNEVFRQLKDFFDIPLPPGYKFSDEKVKFSELQYLSKEQPNYKSKFSENFVNEFIQVIMFFADLNKLMRQDLVDAKLSRIIFMDTIIPWYKYLNKIEFDLIDGIEYGFIGSQLKSLEKRLNTSYLNEVLILHMKYTSLKKEYDKLK